MQKISVKLEIDEQLFSKFSSIRSNTLKMQLKRVNSTLLLKIIFVINERAHIFYNFDKSQKQI